MKMFVVAVASIFAFYAVLALGLHAGHDSILKDCHQMGQTRIGKVVLKCSAESAP